MLLTDVSSVSNVAIVANVVHFNQSSHEILCVRFYAYTELGVFLLKKPLLLSTQLTGQPGVNPQRSRLTKVALIQRLGPSVLEHSAQLLLTVSGQLTPCSRDTACSTGTAATKIPQQLNTVRRQWGERKKRKRGG